MELKAVVSFFATIAAVTCQHNFQSVIDQTQYLQQIEKYGTNFTLSPSSDYHSIYPQLTNLTDIDNKRNESLGVLPYSQRNNTFPAARNSSHTPQPSFNSTERFLNKTIASMSKGVCVKEVPTASLLRRNEVAVAGNGSDPSLSRITVCCEGYQRNVHNFRKCDPICKNDCVNGYCSAPDTCVCYPDHVRNLAGFCLPTCPIGCGNGFCNQNNSCSCKQGFVLETNGKFCVPKCTGGCLNGNCTAPEECSCNKGFSFTAAGKCEATCSKGCKNGDCVAPEVCNCHKGYAKVGDVCQPTCTKGCLNGICTEPEVCQCPGHGWSLDSTGSRCVASCDKPCLNGACSGPNECTCRAGYVLDSFDSFRCVPKCDPPCVNGVCSGSNLCLCYQGFVKDRSVKGSQKCIKP